MKKVIYFFIATLILWLSFSQPAHAQDLSENIQVQAFVESNVSKVNSEVETDKEEVLADKSNVVIITVIVKDDQGNPLENKTVTLISNRGEIDTIEPVANGITVWLPVVYAASANGSASARTDKEGKARFKASSNVAGKAIFRVIVDGYIELDPIEITFNGLPFPSSLTITTSTPTLGGLVPAKMITLFKPTQESSGIVNTGVNVNIPASLFLFLFILLAGAIYFVLNNYFAVRRLRRIESKQLELLNQTLTILKNKGFDGEIKINGELQRGLDHRFKNHYEN